MKSTFKFNGQTINISSGNYVIDVDGDNLSINTAVEAQKPTDTFDIPDNILSFMRPTMEESLSSHLGMNSIQTFDVTKHGSVKDIVLNNFPNVGDKAIMIAEKGEKIRKKFYEIGQSASVTQINKHQKRGPFKYMVTRTDYKNTYTKAASKPRP